MKKSKKLTIIFIVTTVLFVILFFVFFYIAKSIKADWSVYYSQYNVALKAGDETAMASAKALMDSKNAGYRACSVLCYVFSLLGIISAGLGLKLVDKYKTKEEESNNKYVFKDDRNNNEGQTKEEVPSLDEAKEN